MWNSHSKLGLSQTVFYLPALAAAGVLLIFRHRKPRMPWLALFFFSLVRFVGGMILILYENHSEKVAWTVAAIIFQGAGVIPLILVIVGFLRLIKAIDLPGSHVMERAVIGIRVVFLLGIVMLLVGSCFIGNYKSSSSTSLGLKLAKAGYIVIASVLAMTFAAAVSLWVKPKVLSSDSKTILLGIVLSVPFLAVRLAYACLSVFDVNPKWSIIGGDIAPLVLMHSLMEYAVVIICLGIGLLIRPILGETIQMGE